MKTTQDKLDAIIAATDMAHRLNQIGQPGDFIFETTYEEFRLPGNWTAELSLRVHYGWDDYHPGNWADESPSGGTHTGFRAIVTAATIFGPSTEAPATANELALIQALVDDDDKLGNWLDRMVVADHEASHSS